MLILSLQFKVTQDFQHSIPALSSAQKFHSRAFTQGNNEGTDYRVKEPRDIPCPLKGSLHGHRRCCCRDLVCALTTTISYSWSGLSPTDRLQTQHVQNQKSKISYIQSSLYASFAGIRFPFPFGRT